MKVYPPVDSHFYEVMSQVGMTDEQIEEDWRSYCDDMEQSVKEEGIATIKVAEQPRRFRALIGDILNKFKKGK